MGKIVWDSQEKNMKKYMLSSLENCLKLINFLDQYPLQTSKFWLRENLAIFRL